MFEIILGCMLCICLTALAFVVWCFLNVWINDKVEDAIVHCNALNYLEARVTALSNRIVEIESWIEGRGNKAEKGGDAE